MSREISRRTIEKPKLNAAELEQFVGGLVRASVGKNDYRYIYIAGLIRGGIMQKAYPNGFTSSDLSYILDNSKLIPIGGEDLDSFKDGIMFQFSKVAKPPIPPRGDIGR